MKNCPVCKSTRFNKTLDGKNALCLRCGYEYHEKVMGKVLASKNGRIDENWWMGAGFTKK